MNRLTILLTWLILGNSAFLALAQDPCAADLLHEQLKAIDPSYQARHEAMEQRIQQFINNKKYKGAGPAESITQSGGGYSIPVVVHVIYTAPNATNNTMTVKNVPMVTPAPYSVNSSPTAMTVQSISAASYSFLAKASAS